MRAYSEIRDDLTRTVLQAVRNAESELSRARQLRQGRETSRGTLEEALHVTLRQHRDLDSPQAVVKVEITDLESRIRDLQRQLDAKRQQTRDLGSQVEKLAQEIKKHRVDISGADTP